MSNNGQSTIDFKTSFLIGLTLVLSCCFVALEWRSTDDIETFADETFEEMAQEIELPPVPMTPDLVALDVEQQKQVSDQLKLVEQAEEQKRIELKPTPVSGDDEEALPTTPVNAIVPVMPTLDEQPVSFRVVQQLPEFPGGPVQFMKWLTKNLKYPTSAQQKKQQGKVVAQFIVNKDGTVSDIKIVKSLNATCDREAMRVLSMMPKWKPGVQDDKPCRTMFSIPIVFKL